MDPENEQDDLNIQINCHLQDFDSASDKFKKLAEVICKRFELHNAIVNVNIIGDEEIKNLNNKFLGHNRVTDCLSFDLSDDSDKSRDFDLAVNGELAAREAASRKHCPHAELALYITHGLLHNLGFDDDTTEAAGEMHKTEDCILQEQGYGLVYNNRRQ